ncbi:MAG: GIY-YIG nuclease family protein [Spongiibacteraceae bacterium]
MSENSDFADTVTLGDWAVYIIQSDDERLYTGVTNNLERRWQQHSSGRGAKFFRGRKPQALVFVELGHSRASALRREAAIKKLRRVDKLTLIAAEKQTADPLQFEAVPAAKGLRPV